MLLEPAPRTVRGARDLLSVALQYGNAFGQGLQAAALKAADFFGNDDVLYLMEDMATGEIRLSILWEWLHKGATLTADDPGAGVKTGDTFTPDLFRTLLAEEYAKLQAAGNRDVHDVSKTTTLPISREIVETYVTEAVKMPWFVDLLNVNLGNSNLDGGPPADPAAGGRVPERRDADYGESRLHRREVYGLTVHGPRCGTAVPPGRLRRNCGTVDRTVDRRPQKSICTLNLAKRAVTMVVGTRHWLRPVPE